MDNVTHFHLHIHIHTHNTYTLSHTHVHACTHTHTCATCSVLALSTTFRRCASFSSLAIVRGEDWISPIALPWDCRGGETERGEEREGEGTHCV